MNQKKTDQNQNQDNRWVTVGEGFRSFWSRANGNYLMIPTKRAKNILEFSKYPHDNEVDNFWKEVAKNIIRFYNKKIPSYQTKTSSPRQNIKLAAHTGRAHDQTVFHFHFRFEKTN